MKKEYESDSIMANRKRLKGLKNMDKQGILRLNTGGALSVSQDEQGFNGSLHLFKKAKFEPDTKVMDVSNNKVGIVIESLFLDNWALNIYRVKFGRDDISFKSYKDLKLVKSSKSVLPEFKIGDIIRSTTYNRYDGFYDVKLENIGTVLKITPMALDGSYVINGNKPIDHYKYECKSVFENTTFTTFDHNYCFEYKTELVKDATSWKYDKDDYVITKDKKIYHITGKRYKEDKNVYVVYGSDRGLYELNEEDIDRVFVPAYKFLDSVMYNGLLCYIEHIGLVDDTIEYQIQSDDCSFNNGRGLCETISYEEALKKFEFVKSYHTRWMERKQQEMDEKKAKENG